MHGQKFGRKLVKPLRIEKNKGGHKKNRSSTKLEDRGFFIDPDDEECKEILENARRTLERPTAAAMPCKRLPNSITKVTAMPDIESEKNSKTMCGCTVESPQSKKQRVELSQPKKS